VVSGGRCRITPPISGFPAKRFGYTKHTESQNTMVELWYNRGITKQKQSKRSLDESAGRLCSIMFGFTTVFFWGGETIKVITMVFENPKKYYTLNPKIP